MKTDERLTLEALLDRLCHHGESDGPPLRPEDSWLGALSYVMEIADDDDHINEVFELAKRAAEKGDVDAAMALEGFKTLQASAQRDDDAAIFLDELRGRPTYVSPEAERRHLQVLIDRVRARLHGGN